MSPEGVLIAFRGAGTHVDSRAQPAPRRTPRARLAALSIRTSLLASLPAAQSPSHVAFLSDALDFLAA